MSHRSKPDRKPAPLPTTDYFPDHCRQPGCAARHLSEKKAAHVQYPRCINDVSGHSKDSRPHQAPVGIDFRYGGRDGKRQIYYCGSSNPVEVADARVARVLLAEYSSRVRGLRLFNPAAMPHEESTRLSMSPRCLTPWRPMTRQEAQGAED